LSALYHPVIDLSAPQQLCRLACRNAGKGYFLLFRAIFCFDTRLNSQKAIKKRTTIVPQIANHVTANAMTTNAITVSIKNTPAYIYKEKQASCHYAYGN
jgi:hypothetical protein